MHTCTHYDDNPADGSDAHMAVMTYIASVTIVGCKCNIGKVS